MTKMDIITIICLSCMCIASSDASFGFFNNDYSDNGITRAISRSEAVSNTELGTVSATNQIKAKSGLAVAHNHATNDANKAGYNAIYKAVDKAVIETENHGYHEATAEACGSEIAGAVAQAFGKITSNHYSTGDSVICSSTTATAQERSMAYADVIVIAFTKASNEITYTKAQSSAFSQAISSRTADAFAKANADVCLYGPGYVKVAQSTFAKAAFTGYAFACASALSKIFDKREKKIVYEKGEDGENKVKVIEEKESKAEIEGFSTAKSEHEEDFHTKKTYDVESEGNAHVSFNPMTRTVTNGHIPCSDQYAVCCEKPYVNKCDCGPMCTMTKFVVGEKVYYRVKGFYSRFSLTFRDEYECMCQ